MITIALEAKPEVKKGRCKVEFVTALNIAKELEAFCNDKYHLLSGFEVYGHRGDVLRGQADCMDSEQRLLWGCVLAGALDKRHLEEFREHLGNIVWH